MKTITSKSGKKITFRSLQEDDLEEMYKYAKKIEAEDTFITLNPAEPLSLKEEKDYFLGSLKKINKTKLVKLLVLDEEKIIGACDIEILGKRQNHVGNFGIALLKDYRSEGIGFKLAKHIIKLSKQKLNISQIILSCFANNTIGIKYYKKLGFTQYGSHPKAILYQDKLVDQVFFYKNIK